jgi:hypothetical protein
MARTSHRNPHGAYKGPHWPAVEEQMKGVIRGSALEKLILDNQDFGILLPAEADDGLPFPPWLRVWWRKKHPELKFPGPKVGYPLGLKEILHWMLRNQDLPSGQDSAAAGKRQS